MKKVFLILIFVILGSKTTYSQDYFTIVQKESNLPIKIGADTTSNWVYRIAFPIVFEVTYLSCDTMQFYDIEYLNNPLYDDRLPSRWLSTGIVYNYENGKPIVFENKNDSLIFNKDINRRTYVYYTTHAPTNDSLQHAIFAPYVQRMREQKKKVIEIESIQELKAENADLTNTFLIGDSIRFSFRNRKKNLYEELTIPVEVK